MKTRSSIYCDRDPRDVAAYNVAEAARYLRIPPATLRSWVRGRTYPRQRGVGSFHPLIQPAEADPPRLTFTNLVEAHVLRGLRTEHGVPIHAVRPALKFAEKQLGIDRLLLSQELLAGGGELFLERYGSLINLTKSGQIVLRRVLEAYLKRVERDERSIPIKLFPFLSETVDQTRPVVIDPRLSFGQPVLADAGIRTSVIVARIDAGESVDDLAKDYQVTSELIEEALVFERAA